MSWERYHQAHVFIHSYSSIAEIIWEILECVCGFVFHLHVCVVTCDVCARANVRATDQRQCLPSLFSILLLREDPPVNLEFFNPVTLAQQRTPRILISLSSCHTTNPSLRVIPQSSIWKSPST